MSTAAGASPGSARPRAPLPLEDTFRSLLGSPSISVLRPLWGEIVARGESADAARYRDLEHEFLKGMAYGLPDVADSIEDPLEVRLSPKLLERGISNLFESNPKACGVAASIVRALTPPASESEDAVSASRNVVSLYLALSAALPADVAAAYRELLDASSENIDRPRASLDERKRAFERLVERLKGAMNDAWGGPLRRGIMALLVALIVVREERVEEVPLTLDVRLPLDCSWRALSDAAFQVGPPSTGGGATFADLESMTNVSHAELVRELKSLAKHVGRGVGVWELRPAGERAAGKSLFRCSSLWPDHKNAPLSQLYDLNWFPPTTETRPDVRVVLLPNSNLSIISQDDPLFDYLRGEWSYVDLVGKTQVLATVLGSAEPRAEVLHAPIYRIARFCYQLAYHNHGATVELNLDSNLDLRQEPDLRKLAERWDVPGIQPDGMPVWTQPPDENPPGGLHEPHHIGRLAYALSTHDGMCIMELTGPRDAAVMHDFGHFETLDDPLVTRLWSEATSRIGIPGEPLGGARHRSAYQRAIKKSSGRLVLCVSQDGNVDAYVGEGWLRLR